MPVNIDFLTEETGQAILQNLRLGNAYKRIWLMEYDISGWDAAFEIGRSGAANKVFNVGDQLVGKYIISGTEYSCPWDIVGFRDVVAMVGNEQKVYKNAPIIQMHYTGHENVAFDPSETYEATEATAQSGYYYCGYDGTNYTMLALSAGDTIPYGSYTKVYKTLYNSVNAIRYGNSEWQYAWLRQYLNNSGTGWAAKQYECDVLPNNAANITGFLSYLDADLVRNLHPIKIKTKQANYTGDAVIETWDKMFPLSVSEMNMKSTYASVDDGEPLAYYKQLLDSETKKDTGTYSALIKYAVNGTTSAQTVRLRSASLASYYVWYVYASGNVSSYDYPCYASRQAPACALV